MILRWMILVLIAGLALPKAAHADELRPGYLELTQRNQKQWQVLWKAPILGGLATRARPQLPAFCTLQPLDTRLDNGSLISSIRAICQRPLEGEVVGIEGMEASFTDALLRVAPLGRPIQAERLTPDHPTAIVAAKPSGWDVAKTYLELGVVHILTGYDHLLFVVSLVLLLQQGWVIVRAATAFTLAHSLTLIGTTLGVIGLEQAPVEALIALSIVFLAVEILKKGDGQARLSARVPWLVAFLFGLLHGFGFAGALREIGLPETDVPTALFTFNLGVEIGQLVIIAASMAVLFALRRWRPLWLRPATIAATYTIGGTASFWFIGRLIG